MSEVPDTGAEAPQSAAAKLFDLRVLIGGLFLLYGVMLTVAGLFSSSKELAKASHININLWMGLGMLVIGAFFTTWWRLRPLQRPEPDQPKAYETGTGRCGVSCAIHPQARPRCSQPGAANSSRGR